MVGVWVIMSGREKLGCSTSDAVRLVLESDGTHIDDGEYLKWLPDNTVFLLLRAGEPWTPQRKHHSSSSTPASGSACSSQQQLPQPPPASSKNLKLTIFDMILMDGSSLL